MQDIQETVKSIIASQLNMESETLEGSASLKDNLNVDSMDGVELILRLEDAFGVDLQLEAMATIRTVQDMIDYIRVNQEPSAAA